MLSGHSSVNSHSESYVPYKDISISFTYYPLTYTVDMVAYFCHHLSDNYVDLSDVLSTCQIKMSTCQVMMSTLHERYYVDFSNNFVAICMTLTGQEHFF